MSTQPPERPTEALPLPDDPSLEQLRKRARELQRARPGTPLNVAQLQTARRYGFPSWPAIKRHVELRRSYRRAPDEVPEQPRAEDEFLRLACLTYGEDEPQRWTRAAAMSAVPQTVWVAAARCDVVVLRRLLAQDRSLATREGGPFAWAPLAYLAYARHDPDVREADTLAAARLLLEHGADPDTGYLWHGLNPFTVLTGCFGEGEGGPVRQPPHPHGFALARLLLEAGADANDSQALYNRMFSPAVDHLVLLLEHGLGQGDGGPWKRRLGAAVGSPAELLADQFAWAVVHGYEDRIRLLVAAGVDPAAPLRGHPALRAAGAGAVAVARRSAQLAAAALLEELGAPVVEPDVEERVLEAVLAGDRAEVDRLEAAEPGAVQRARDRRPGLVVWAASLGRPDAVRVAVELGWDVNRRARTDVPSDQEWETALHHAAGNGELPLTALLLELGADITIRDARFDGTPLDWAEHFGQEAVVELLSDRSG
jgi:ankyrin repeat protein